MSATLSPILCRNCGNRPPVPVDECALCGSSDILNLDDAILFTPEVRAWWEAEDICKATKDEEGAYWCRFWHERLVRYNQGCIERWPRCISCANPHCPDDDTCFFCDEENPLA